MAEQPPPFDEELMTQAPSVPPDAQPERNVPDKEAMMKPDYSKLVLKGDGHAQDSFSLTMQAAARLFGKDVDYETIYALSTNGFAPGLMKGESCTDWWGLYARDHGFHIVTGRIGLGSKPFEIPHAGPTPEMDQEESEKACAEQRLAAAPGVRAALAAGQIIVTDFGWSSNGPHGFIPWHWWGLYTEARDDGTILGATINGHSDNPVDYLGSLWSLWKAEPTLSPEEADIEMLRRAVHRIRGTAEPFVPGKHMTMFYGLAAMDLWAEQMEEVPFCPDCRDKSWTCAKGSAITPYEGAKVVSSYLRKRMATFPEAARPHIEATAKHYDRIAELLHPAITGEGGESYEEFIGDIEKQKAHIENVLKPVKAELAAAADEIEEALAAIQQAKVKREGDRVWVEGLERLQFGKQRDNQFVEALTVALHAMGEDMSYDQLMGWSGAAFRLHFWDKEFCPSSADLLGGFNHAVPAGEAMGYSVETIRCDDRDEPGQAELRSRIVASIDAGIPVMANSLMGHGSWGVIAGYDDDGETLLCRTYDDEDAGYTASTIWPWTVMFVEKIGERQTKEENRAQSLRNAVELARTESYERDGRQTSGFAAYERWISELRDDDLFRAAEQDATFYFAEANGWIYLALLDARGSAERYLRNAALGADKPVAAHLLAAAEIYGEIHRKLLDGQKHAPAPWQLPGESWTKAIPHPEAGEAIKQWTDEMRHSQASVLTECLALERQAIAEIEKALAAEHVKEFTPGELERLAQWSSMWGDLDACIRVAGREPVHFDLLRLELSLEPISEDARDIRDWMRLEPADSCYPQQIEDLLRSIAAGRLTGTWPPVVRTPERLERLKKLATALRAWSDGLAKEGAAGREGTDAVTVDEIYGHLGAVDDEKKAVVAITIEKLESGHSERGVQIELKDNPATLEEALAHNVTMCDTQCWTFEHNLAQLLQRIGGKEMNGGWGEPDGPISWSLPRAMNPEFKPRLALIVKGLDAWFTGEPCEDAQAQEIVDMLGGPDAYSEKVWLARSLHNYLSHHAAGTGY